MLALCNECHNHYDDESQASECAGIGRVEGYRAGVASSHAVLRDQTAIDEHADMTRAARTAVTMRATLGGQERAVTVPSADAAP